MVLPEGAVVSISRGLRFIGQRLDPRPFLKQMSDRPIMSETGPGETFDPGQKTAQDAGSNPFNAEKTSDLAEEIKRAIEGNGGDRGVES